MDEDFKIFRQTVIRKRAKGKVRNSWGTYDAYKLIRKHGWWDIGRPLKEHEFYTITRKVNDLLAKETANGNLVKFPCRMGSLELRKSFRKAYFKDNKLYVTYPVDWKKTLRLWFENKEAMKDKILVRNEGGLVYKVKYCRYNATYNNKIFYEFTLNRNIKKALKENIKEGIVDTAYTYIVGK